MKGGGEGIEGEVKGVGEGMSAAEFRKGRLTFASSFLQDADLTLRMKPSSRSLLKGPSRLSSPAPPRVSETLATPKLRAQCGLITSCGQPSKGLEWQFDLQPQCCCCLRKLGCWFSSRELPGEEWLE